MKQALKHGWITKLGGVVLISLLAQPVHAQLMLAHEGHHDTADCSYHGGEFPVGFNGYEVPDNDLPPLHAFCQNIPTPGKVNLTVELFDWDSREIPLAVRLVKVGHDGHGGGHGGHDDSHGDEVHEEVEAIEVDEDAHEADEHAGHDDHHEGHDMDGHAGHDDHEHEGHDMDEHAGHDDEAGHSVEVSDHGIVYMPPQTHRSGIIVMSADLPDRGNYEILLERHDDDGNITVAARVPFAVGGSGGHGGHGGGFGMIEIILLLAAVGGGAYFYMQRKKTAEGSTDKS